MTKCDYRMDNGVTGTLEELYRLEDRESTQVEVALKEEKIMERVKAFGGVPLRCNTELISKRRYKRRRAKALNKLAKLHR